MAITDRPMDVLVEAERLGFSVTETVRKDDQRVWAWRRGADERWPCFLTKREAIGWMRDRIQRGGVFDR